MKEVDFIVGIFNYLNPFPELHGESAYYLLYLLDEKGMLDKSGAQKLYEEKFKSDLSSIYIHPNMIGPFDSTDHVNQFAFLLCEELNAQKVSLLSVQEYNSLLENTHSALDFQRDLVEKGNVMENIERKKKGFLSRFF